MPLQNLHKYRFLIANSEGGACLCEYATASPPVSGATNYGSFNFVAESGAYITFTFLSAQSSVTCYATLDSATKDKSNIGSATYTS